MSIRLLMVVIAVLCASSFGLAAQSQSQTQDSKAQNTGTDKPTKGGAAGSADNSSSQPKSLADIAREAKQKKQKSQSENQESTAKKNAYTDDNFVGSSPTAPSSVQSPMQNQPGTATVKEADLQSLMPRPGPDNVVITKFELESASIKRPGSSNFRWMLQNKSENYATTVTIALVTTGPCNYHVESSNNVKLTQGSGYTDNFSIGSAIFSASDCAGTYSFELRVSGGGKLLQSATTTVNVI